jgi:hypothetical protein
MESITNFIGGGYQDMLGREMTIEDATELFYKTHDCLSDDSDKEDDRVVEWANREGITLI